MEPTHIVLDIIAGVLLGLLLAGTVILTVVTGGKGYKKSKTKWTAPDRRHPCKGNPYEGPKRRR